MASFLWMELNCHKATEPLQGDITCYQKGNSAIPWQFLVVMLLTSEG